MVLPLMFILFQAVASSRPQATVITSCDPKEAGGVTYSSTHAPGEDWFSLTGHVFDPEGAPLCGERISVEYLTEVSSQWGTVAGPNSLIGRDGLFFLDNIKKNTPFRVRVNPYGSAERLVQREGPEGIVRLKASGKTVRAEGIERFRSDELRSTSPSGVVTMDFRLRADPAAVGMVIGSVGKEALDRDSQSVARIRVVGREDIETPVGLDGTFVVLGIPAGKHEITAELSIGREKRILRRTVTVGSGNGAVGRVRFAP